MKFLMDEAVTAFREYMRDTAGRAPNRMMMTEDTAKRLRDELLSQHLYDDPHPLTLEQVIFHGMRLVVDPNAVGIEVGYVR